MSHHSGRAHCQIFIVQQCEWLLLIEALAEAFSCLWSESSFSEQIYRWLLLLIWTTSPFDEALCKWTTHSRLADYPAMLQKGRFVLNLRKGSHQCRKTAESTLIDVLVPHHNIYLLPGPRRVSKQEKRIYLLIFEFICVYDQLSMSFSNHCVLLKKTHPSGQDAQHSSLETPPPTSGLVM